MTATRRWSSVHKIPFEVPFVEMNGVVLYDSNMAVNDADVPRYGIKFTSPIVANGEVYISTAYDGLGAATRGGELDAYGLKEKFSSA